MSNSTQGNKTIPQLPNASAINTGMLFHGWDPTAPIGSKDIAFPASLLQSSAVMNYFPPNGPQTTVSAFLNQFLQYPSGQFYQNAGARVNRMRDRVFIGDACLNNATNVAVQPDWLTTYQIAKGRTYGYVQTSQASILNTSANQDSLTTLVVGAQAAGRVGSQVIAVTGMGVNNATSGGTTNQAWAGYFEAFRDTGSAGQGGAYGIEIDTMNFVGAGAVTDPYVQSGDQTISAQLAAGGGFPGTMYPTTVGVNFQNNNSTFDKGIVFGSNSISGADGTNGTGIAIAFGKGHTMQWYGSAGITTSSILCSGTTTANSIQQFFKDNEVQFNNASGKQIFDVFGVANGVNGLQVLGAATTNNPQLVAVGSDTNITLQISPKGSGTVAINGTLTPNQTQGIVGTTTNNSAQAGSVGEIITNSATGVSLTTATTANITTISLTAGDWDVSGTVTFVPANTTAPTIMQCGTSTTSATLGALGTQQFLGVTFPTNGQTQGFVAPLQRISIASTTTVYLVAQSSFSTSTMTANGFIRARRVR